MMIKDTPGYREMMRMTHDNFLEILMLVEPACMLLQKISLPFLCFVFLYDSEFLRFQSPQFQQRSPKLLPRYKPLSKRGTHARAKHV